MLTIYVVTGEPYHDNSTVLAVHLSREAAEADIATLPVKPSVPYCGQFEDYAIAEVEIGAPAMATIRAHQDLYSQELARIDARSQQL